MADNKQSFDTEFSGQAILNRSYDRTTSVLGVEILTYNGTANPTRLVSKEMATKVTVSGSATYVAKAPIASAQASAVWQAKKIDTSSGVVITWANGNASFNNVATDLTALTYS